MRVTVDIRRPATNDQSLLGIAFDAEALGRDQASARAWQMWMERLDPQEMRGAAFYDGAVQVAGGRRGWIIAVSGSPECVAYARDAFSAPDLAAFPGIVATRQRFIAAADLPRERLALRAYVDDRGRLVPQSADDTELVALALRAQWPTAAASQPLAPRPAPPPRPRAAAGPDETLALRAAPLDGATNTELRIWKPTRTVYAQLDRRRRFLLGALGTVLILAAVALVGARALALHPLVQAQGRPTPTRTGGSVAPGVVATITTLAVPVMVVAPLTIRTPCAAGRTVQFTISNNGAADLQWSSNLGQFTPRIAANTISGTIPPGNSQVVLITTQEVVRQQETVLIAIISNGGSAQVSLTIGGC